MKNAFLLLLLISIVSCVKKQEEASEDFFEDLKEEVVDKFGTKSYYSGLTVTLTPQGKVVSVLQTNNPLKLELTCYVHADGIWKEMYIQPLTALRNTKPEKYMFHLDETIDAYTLSKVVNDAKKDIRDRIHVKDLKLYQVSIRPPKSGNLSTMHYYVTIKSDSLQRDFNYRYNIDGTLDNAELNNTAD
ncbi:MAG: hypothetical protein RSH24_20230 [Flavobacterium sp.]